MGIIIKDGVIYGNNEPHPEFIEIMPNAGFHNSIFRGKYLGASFTEAQSNAIKAGTFDDLFVGDYWTINGINWRIADFDPYYRHGDNTGLDTHHIAVVPDTNLYSTKWNDTNTVTSYVDSAIRANIKASSASAAGAEAKFIAAFGSSHVLSYRAMYPTTYTDGVASAWAWTDARVELMNENEVFGTQIWNTSPREVGISNRQFSLFKLYPELVNNRINWWLRNVAGTSNGALLVSFVCSQGLSNRNTASTNYGVRPFALIA